VGFGIILQIARFSKKITETDLMSELIAHILSSASAIESSTIDQDLSYHIPVAVIFRSGS
jgi:hypothetical protein